MRVAKTVDAQKGCFKIIVHMDGGMLQADVYLGILLINNFMRKSGEFDHE